MNLTPFIYPLGYGAATKVLELGRAAFFGSADTDLPLHRSSERSRDDRIPSFGYVGTGYQKTRVLLLGINPGNGPNDARAPGDEKMIPVLFEFAEHPSPASFLTAQDAYREACRSWPIWSRHCAEIIGAGGLSLDEVAYSNCLPWRTESKSKFADSVAERAATLYVQPLIEELKPRVIIALGKRAAEILYLCEKTLPTLIVWNRAQAATAAVLEERSATAARIFAILLKKPRCTSNLTSQSRRRPDMRKTLYNTNGKLLIADRDEMIRAISEGKSRFYVYVLCSPPVAKMMQPFYIGIGQNDRLFSHEVEAGIPTAVGRKVEKIRKIWSVGGQVVRVIDGFFEQEPWPREGELINQFGLVKDGSGILLNEQRYAPSHLKNGIELRKYAEVGNDLPSNFIRRFTRLMTGTRTPNSASVYGKICNVLAQYPGVTGEELVKLLLNVDFSMNKSAYTAPGVVSRPWLAKYIDGGFYVKNKFIREFAESKKAKKGVKFIV